MRFTGSIVIAIAMLPWLSPASAQQPAPRGGAPRIGYVYPAGGQHGATISVTVGGESLEAGASVDFAGRGITARVVEFQRPLNQKEFGELKERSDALQAKRKAAHGQIGPDWSQEDEETLKKMREKLAAGPANRQLNPAIAERVTLEVTIDADTPPGTRDLRVKTSTGLSNPLVFIVGQLPESSAPPARGDPRMRRPGDKAPAARPSGPPREVVLPAVANGQIMPGEVDHIRFSAKQGQHIVVAVGARALIPYLADAVPGWFQATIALQDADGRELAYDDDFLFNPDPALAFVIPRDGDYTVEIKDSIYRGREDFVYRVTIGEVPFITSIFPLGGPADATTTVSLRGWNLPLGHVTVDGRARSAGDLLLSVRRDGLLSNSVPFALEEGEECVASEQAAQPLTLPVTVNGRIESAGDVDVFSFSGHAGEAVIAEVFARRLNSPLDSVLKITDAAGTQIANNDDNEDRGSGLTTHHADSRVAFTLPADGAYFVHLGDTQHQGGDAFGYRLHVGAPQPDFELRIAPSSITVRGGMRVPVTAHVLRRDGFNGPITLALRGAPAGFVVEGARIPEGQNSVRFTLAAPAVTEDVLLGLAFEGRAEIDGRHVVRHATPAEDMMQAFSYRHLVPAQAQLVDVIAKGGRARPGAPRLAGSLPLQLPRGGTAHIRVTLPPNRGGGIVHFQLSQAPDGIAMLDAATKGDFVELTFTSDASKTMSGLAGNLIILGSMERADPDANDKKQGPRRIPIGALPAIPFEIVAP